MKYSDLRSEVCAMNRQIQATKLAALTWGNVSGVDRDSGVIAIKPSGVSYDDLMPEHIVIVSLDDAKVVEGSLNPSSDTLSHIEIYRGFDKVGGVVHTHSHFATVWAQAQRDIPCFGTTHADVFYGSVPLTRLLTEQEVDDGYELNTGKVIVERFASAKIDPLHMPGVVVSGHGPFTWGKTPSKALEHAIVLEHVAKMAFDTLSLNPDIEILPKYIMDKHFLRKHGANAYYGQGGKND